MSKKHQTKRFTPKLHVKKGDKVMVIAGSSKGDVGEILEIFPHKNRAIVDNVNLVKKHTKPTEDNPQGGILDIPAALHLSNLMLIDPKTGEPTRVGRKIENDKLVRYSKKTGEII